MRVWLFDVSSDYISINIHFLSAFIHTHTHTHTHTRPSQLSITIAQSLNANWPGPSGFKHPSCPVQIPSPRKFLTGWPLSEACQRFFQFLAASCLSSIISKYKIFKYKIKSQHKKYKSWAHQALTEILWAWYIINISNFTVLPVKSCLSVHFSYSWGGRKTFFKRQ